MAKLKGKRREALSSLRVLQRKEMRSNQYQQKKSRSEVQSPFVNLPQAESMCLTESDQQPPVTNESSPTIVIPNYEDLTIPSPVQSPSANPEIPITATQSSTATDELRSAEPPRDSHFL